MRPYTETRSLKRYAGFNDAISGTLVHYGQSPYKKNAIQIQAHMQGEHRVNVKGDMGAMPLQAEGHPRPPAKQPKPEERPGSDAPSRSSEGANPPTP